MTFDRLDRLITALMRRWGVRLLRWSLAVVFVWFGVLKPLGLSPAEPVVLKTVAWMPVLTADQWLSVIGWWEVAIGITFLFRRTLRLAIALLLVQMIGTFLPLAILPEITFQPGRFPYAPTLEGQYIIKNLLIISGALAIGGTLRRSESEGAGAA